MDRVIQISGKDVGFRATALTPRLYRHKMGRDMVRDLTALQKAFSRAVEAQGLTPNSGETPEEKAVREGKIREAQLTVMDLEIFENAAYVMARQYDPTIPDTPEEWLDTFDGTFSIYEILPTILELWSVNNMTTAVPKKK